MKGRSAVNRNTLHERDNSLPTVDYIPLLTAIKATVDKEQQFFQIKPDQLHIAIAQTATRVTEKLQRANFKDIDPFLTPRGTQFSSVNFADSLAFRTFRTHLEKIQSLLQGQLEQTISAQLGPNTTREDYVKKLLSTSKSFTSQKASRLSYPFDEKEALQKRRLHMQTGKKYTGPGTRLMGHKLTIQVNNIHNFDAGTH